MADGGAFDIPSLENEEILECLQMGILGEGATNFLMEHLDHPKERGTEKKEEMRTQVEQKRLKIEPLKSWLAQKKPRTQLKQEVEVLREDEKQYLKIKEERDLLLTEVKSKLHQDTVMLEKQQEILSCVSAEKEKLLQKMVASPAHHKEKMDQAVLNLKLAEDKKVEMLANLREVEEKTASLEPMSELLGEVNDTLRDNFAKRASFKQIQSDFRSAQFKIDHQKMSAEAVRQRARDARDEIATYQEAISKQAVHMQQRQAKFEQAKEELEREKNIADSVKDKTDKEVAELERETETYRKRLQDKEREAEECKRKFESREDELMCEMGRLNEDFERQMQTLASQFVEQIEPQ